MGGGGEAIVRGSSHASSGSILWELEVPPILVVLFAARRPQRGISSQYGLGGPT